MRSSLGGDTASVGRDASGELDDVDEARPHDGAIVDGALTCSGAAGPQAAGFGVALS